MCNLVRSSIFFSFVFLFVFANSPYAQAEQQVLFRFKVGPHPESFVMKVEGKARIAEARTLLESGKPKVIMGKIIKKPKNYNNEWGFHLQPSSIKFVEMAMEVCDSSIKGVEDNLDGVGGAFLPGNVWCPWSSKIVEEVKIPRGKYFEFEMKHDPDSKFVVKLTDIKQIKKAREIIENSESKIIMGTISKHPVRYNSAWSFHLESSSISFIEVAPEVCDAATEYVEDNLDEVGGAFLPGNVWCPWSSNLVREVRTKKDLGLADR